MTKKLGGSFGIALVSSFLDWRNQMHWTRLSGYVNNFDSKVNQRLDSLYHGFMSSGSSSEAALQQSYQTMSGTLMRQVQMMSYNDIFLGVGVFFLACIPFLIFTYDNSLITRYFQNPFAKNSSNINS